MKILLMMLLFSSGLISKTYYGKITIETHNYSFKTNSYEYVKQDQRECVKFRSNNHNYIICGSFTLINRK